MHQAKRGHTVKYLTFPKAASRLNLHLEAEMSSKPLKTVLPVWNPVR